jgi:hypothetical protein
MRSRCGVSAMAEWPSKQTERQLELVWDTGASEIRPESGTPGPEPGGRGDGRGATSLGAYIGSLQAGDRCFCCGGRLAEGADDGGGRILTCRLCGAEVVRSRAE